MNDRKEKRIEKKRKEKIRLITRGEKDQIIEGRKEPTKRGVGEKFNK